MKSRRLIAMCVALTCAASAAFSQPQPGSKLQSPPPPHSPPHAVFGPFAHAPLDGPLTVTGTFGEYRPGRFHAGIDYSTGGHVGLPVYAPLEGWIERVRASGAGYGRSLYLHAPDGRTIVLGHLDAYGEPIASYVAAAQDSSGQYEQDLWLERGRFPVKAGQRLGWSGQSGGVGEPHLHLEVRRGDMAIHPLLAGASAEDSIAPVIAGIMIEPRGTTSTVNGHAVPLRLGLGARPETVSVFGFARIEVEAHDPGARRSDMQPYEIEMVWGVHRVACRFDSLSWATDMPEGDLVYDRGRVFDARAHAVSMWAPADFRPRAIVTDVSLDHEAGTLGLLEKAPIEPVRVAVRDFAGRSVEREFVVKFEPPNPAAGSQPMLMVVTRPREQRLEGFGWLLNSDASFDGGTSWVSVGAETLGTEAAAGDLVPVGRAIHIGPDWMPLRKPFSLRASVPVQHPDRQLGLYVRRDSDWELLSTAPDTTRMPAKSGQPAVREGEVWLGRSGEEWSRPSWIAHPMHLGRFAFFEDRLAPRVSLIRHPRYAGAAKPYFHWALEARLTEAGSGVDVRASYFVVDGKRRPSEWDGVHQSLRWRPLRAPLSGTHHYGIVVSDRAGNVRRASGRFVIN